MYNFDAREKKISRNNRYKAMQSLVAAIQTGDSELIGGCFKNAVRFKLTDLAIRNTEDESMQARRRHEFYMWAMDWLML